MIIDRIENIEQYVGVHPLFAQVLDFFKSADLKMAATGKIIMQDGNLVFNFTESTPKKKKEARLETHNEFIDIQLPLSGIEMMGYAPRNVLAETPYDAENDISFYDINADIYFTVKPGMFVIFFPQDAHAPAITSAKLRKLIIKIKANV